MQHQGKTAILRLPDELDTDDRTVIEPFSVDWQLTWIPHERSPAETCNATHECSAASGLTGEHATVARFDMHIDVELKEKVSVVNDSSRGIGGNAWCGAAPAFSEVGGVLYIAHF